MAGRPRPRFLGITFIDFRIKRYNLKFLKFAIGVDGMSPIDMSDFASTPFDPVPEFEGKQARAEMQRHIENFSRAARVAHKIMSMGKTALVDSLSHVDGHTAAGLADLLRDAAEEAAAFLEILEAAETRTLIVLADQTTMSD